MSTSPAPVHLPPWLAMVQAHADQAESALVARDIARGAYETVVGPHVQTHRGDPRG